MTGPRDARWFFGSDAALPRWAGYTLGYRFVEGYLLAHPGNTAAGLVDAPANAFRPNGASGRAGRAPGGAESPSTLRNAGPVPAVRP